MPSRLYPSSSHYHLLRVHVLSSSTQHPLRKAVIISVTASALAFFAVAVLFFLIYWYRKLLKQRCNNKTSPEDGSSFKIRRFKYRHLKRATKCFSQSQKLGKGGFGVVYRGLLRNGKEVAVKRLDLSSLQGEREFQSELSICSKLDSPHVVRLLGYCTHGKRVRLLVYECMQNRSLQEALFEKGYHTHLDWGKRLKIILDVAKALEFLHLRCGPPIVHGDVKPSNILLDSNFSARIADFGLARFRTEDSGSDSARVSTTAPEKLTSDRFRFGTFDNIAPRTPETSRNPTTGPFSEYSYRPTAESPSVMHKLLAKEAPVGANISAGELAGELDDVMGAASALAQVFHDEADTGLQERDSCGRKVHSKVPVDEALKDVQVYNSCELSKSLRLEFGSKELTPLPIKFGSKEQILLAKAPAENDLWWSRQEAATASEADPGGKEYVMDWLDSDLCGSSRNVIRQAEDEIVPALNEIKGPEAKEQNSKPSCELTSTEMVRKERRKAKPMQRKSREWWKDEYFAELNSKNKANQNFRRKRAKNRSVDNWKDFLSAGELAGRSFSGELSRIDHRLIVAKEVGRSRSKEWLRNTRSGDQLSSWCRGRDHYRRPLRAPSNDISGDYSNGPISSSSELILHHEWSAGDVTSKSGELVSRDVSSTTSMRGTVCYVAPEYGRNGSVVCEKSDIYSFGVLMLVILSGRRPIQVTASPMKDFERANLISWARCLSQSGKLLDLMDQRLQGEYNHKQANMCITLALLCLQRVPTTRPDISEVVKILSGDTMAPPLPLELSPSPPSRTHYRLPARSSKDLHS